MTYQPTKIRTTLLVAAAFSALSLTPVAKAGGMLEASEMSVTKLAKCEQGDEIEKTGVVSGGVDGDTVRVKTKSGIYSVRLLGIDTPESNYQRHSQGVWATLASRAMKELLPEGAQVKLEFGETPCDSHGRPLAQVFRGRVHVNAEILKKGLAVNYCVAPEFRYCDEFSRITQHAIDTGTGMYSDPKVELPYDFRRRISGNEQRSYVGNLQTKIVYGPGNQEKTPPADRVFFYTVGDIKAPYHLED